MTTTLLLFHRIRSVYTGVRHGAAFLVRIIDFHTRTTADEVEIFTELLLVSVKTSQLKVDSGTND